MPITDCAHFGAAGPVDDSFQLYNLRVEVICLHDKRILCGAKDGDYFTLEGEMLRLLPRQGISIHSLGTILPLLSAKQRETSPNDWMSTDAEVACPDPHCPSTPRIIRTAARTFKHSDVTVVPSATRPIATDLQANEIRRRLNDSLTGRLGPINDAGLKNNGINTYRVAS